GGAELRAGQAGIGVGRLAGADRSGDPAALAPRVLRLLLLLVGVEPGTDGALARRRRGNLPASPRRTAPARRGGAGGWGAGRALRGIGGRAFSQRTSSTSRLTACSKARRPFSAVACSGAPNEPVSE